MDCKLTCLALSDEKEASRALRARIAELETRLGAELVQPKVACPYDMGPHICAGCATHDREISTLRGKLAAAEGALVSTLSLMESMQPMGYFTNPEWRKILGSMRKAISTTGTREAAILRAATRALELETYGYECIAGPLRNARLWMDLCAAVRGEVKDE